MKNYQRIHIWDLPKEEFTLKLKDDYLKELIKLAKNRLGNYRKLVITLREKCESFRKNTLESAEFRLNKCTKKEYFLPLSCLFEICEILNLDLEDVEKKVEFLAVKYVKNPLKINFPIIFNEDFVIVSEIIRAEGHLWKNFRKIELANNDIRILNQFTNSLKNMGINRVKYSLYTKITIPYNINREDIKLIDINNTGIIKNFSIRNKKLSNGTKKQLHLYDYDVHIGTVKKYKIITPNGNIICKIKIPENGKIKRNSNYFTEYKSNITSALKVIVGNIVLGKLLHFVCRVPIGKKSDKVYLPDILTRSPKSVIKKGFEVTFNCEGNVSKHALSIKSIGREYLEDWKKVLKEIFDIDSSIIQRGIKLNITHKENFRKLLNEFNFLPEERKKIEKMAEGRTILHPNTSDNFYLGKIKEQGKITSRKLAQITGRTQACTKRVLSDLFKRGLLKREEVWRQGDIKRYCYSLP